MKKTQPEVLYAAWVRGWRDGASMQPATPTAFADEERTAYHDGYTAGGKAVTLAAEEERKRLKLPRARAARVVIGLL